MTIINLLVEKLTYIMNFKFQIYNYIKEDLDKIINGEIDCDKILHEFYI